MTDAVLVQRLHDMVDRLLTRYGTEFSVTAPPTPKDPVTGVGGASGATAQVLGAVTTFESDVLSPGLSQASTSMLILKGDIAQGSIIADVLGKDLVVSTRTMFPIPDGSGVFATGAHLNG